MIDSHSHIYGERFLQDQPAVIQRAIDAKVKHLLQVGCTVEESRQVVALSERVQGIYASVGVHPHDAIEVDDAAIAALNELATHPKVIAWGEIGLDFYYDNSPRDIQIAAFEAQIQRPAALGLPVVIHTRDAEPETLDILRRYPVPRGGHVHCFTGTADMARQLLDLGFHLGFTGIITFKKSQDLRDVVRQTPLDRILIETDSPYLAPVPHRGKRNEPAFVLHVAEMIAEIHGVTLAQVLDQTDENFYRLYAKEGLTWQPLALSA